MRLIVAENPSTGYSWQLDAESAKGLWTTSEEYHAAMHAEGMVGVPGHKTITLNFASDAMGVGVLRAVQARPWEWKGFNDESFKKESFAPRNIVEFSVKVGKD